MSAKYSDNYSYGLTDDEIREMTLDEVCEYVRNNLRIKEVSND